MVTTCPEVEPQVTKLAAVLQTSSERENIRRRHARRRTSTPSLRVISDHCLEPVLSVIDHMVGAERLGLFRLLIVADVVITVAPIAFAI